MSMNKQQALLTAAMAVGVLAVMPMHASAEETTPAETTTAPITTTTAASTTTTVQTTAASETAPAETVTQTGTESYLTASMQITKNADGTAYCLDGDKKRTGRFSLSPNFPLGDLDHSGTVDAADAVRVLIAAAKSGVTEQQEKAGQILLDIYKEDFDNAEQALAFADINEDGVINAVDATEILVHAARVGNNANTSPIGTYEYWALSNGELRTGFFTDPETGKTFYADSEYRLAERDFVLDGKKYIVDEDGSVTEESSIVESGWKTENGKTYYYLEDGTLPEPGWMTIEGKTYFINADGSVAMQTWTETDKGLSYFNAEGELQKGWIRLDDGTYYSDADGVRLTGQRTIDGKIYYFSPEDGRMQTGWVVTEDAWRYYSDAGVLQAGWLTLDGDTYYLQPDGTRVTGLKRIEDYIYYFDPETGKRQSGFVDIEGTVFYFSPETGRLQAGWLEIGEDKYYLLSNGQRASGMQQIADAEGNQHWYYFSPETGIMQTGLVEMDGGVRFFREDGTLYAGWQTDSSGNYYYFKSDGFRAAGPVVINDEPFFFDPDTGVMKTDGWNTYQGKTYYSNTDGRLYRSWHIIAADTYYFLPTDYHMVTGWLETGGYRYYFDENGVMQTNTTVDDWYLMDDGHAVSQMLYYIDTQAQTALANYGSTPDAICKYVNSTANYSKNLRAKTPNELPGWTYMAYYSMLGGTVTSDFVAAEVDYMLRKAGYVSIIMYDTTSTGYHYWNQVKIGDAWYNYDACNGWYQKTDAEISKLGGYNTSPLPYFSNDQIVYE